MRRLDSMLLHSVSDTMIVFVSECVRFFPLKLLCCRAVNSVAVGAAAGGSVLGVAGEVRCEQFLGRSFEPTNLSGVLVLFDLDTFFTTNTHATSDFSTSGADCTT